MRTTQRKGDAAKAKAVHTFTLMGYDVAILLTESAAYDLIIDTGANLYRVQTRFSRTGKEVPLWRIHSNSKGYVVKKTAAGAYDWLYILTADGREYLIEECLEGRNCITPKESDRLVWKGGRVVDCTGLENQQRRKAFEGSNPSPSA